jgi:cyclophilin family peptidyl-prolyl cis-trans isomerase
MASVASAQTVRFETTMGNFDMVLNPTHNTALQGYVDNFMKYVNSDRYLGSWIQRAAKNQDGSDFVLQMGGFFSNTKRPPLTVDSTVRVATFNPVTGVPASTLGLSNTRGTVALALPSDANGVPFRDAGTSSFFVNLNDNTHLDPDFTVFAVVPDLTVIDKIMDLTIKDLSASPEFGSGGFTDVPIQADGKQVFIRRAFIVSNSSSLTGSTSSASSLAATSTSGALSVSAPLTVSNTSSSELISSSARALVGSSVPEPATCLIALAAGWAFCAIRRRR